MKRLIIPIMTILICFNAYSQRDGKMQERIKTQKVAFITDRLDLSPEEAQKFWPIYNDFENKTNKIRQNDLREVRKAMHRGNLSESEAQQILDQYMNVEDKLHEAKKQLVKDLGKVIPPQKIIQLKATENAFNKKLMSMLQQRREKMQEMRKNRKN
ncbi:MAG: sensor of ECF-type sigma factor [Flavobacteriaceae bacterium]|nr:sensor of ECF-type sigma factor [Flavobacteriaceae bacterium]